MMAENYRTLDIIVWSVEELINASSKPARGNNVVTIPDFQRRLVWSKKKQGELINSIRMGYPFGSIMLYGDAKKTQASEDNKKYYSLIDGLQRTHALRTFIKNQNSFYAKDNVPEETVNLVATVLGRANKSGKARVRQSIVKWVNGVASFDAKDGWGSTGLLAAVICDVLHFQPDSQAFTMEFAKLSMDSQFQQTLGAFLDMASSEARSVLNAKVPVMIYEGEPKHVPKVFSLLNSKGTPLNKYEILAAQWVNERRPIENHDIIDAIWMKNQAVEDQGFILDVVEKAPDEATRKTREYSLYDYLFGLGHILPGLFPRLFKDAKNDRPNADSFNLVTSCFGLHLSQMGTLPDKLVDIDLSTLENCLLQSCRFVDNQLKPILAAKQLGRSKAPIYHTQLLIVAMIATAFQARFGVRDLTENPQWKDDREKLKKTIPMFYLYEILQDAWRGSGDTRLFNRVKNMFYLNQSPPTDIVWNQVLDYWYDNVQINYEHDKRRSRHVFENRTEYLFLRYLFVRQLQQTENFHIEHIMPISYLQQNMADDETWPINTIGNLALMERAGELKNNTVPYTLMLWQKRQLDEITADQFNYQLREYTEQLMCPARIMPESLSKQIFREFLKERFELLKSEFLRVWRDHIPADPQT